MAGGLPLAERTRREYMRWVRMFRAWLGDGVDVRAVGADPLVEPQARDYAARDFKRYLKLERGLGPASVNLGLSAVDHFYRHLGPRELLTADVSAIQAAASSDRR